MFGHSVDSDLRFDLGLPIVSQHDCHLLRLFLWRFDLRIVPAKATAVSRLLQMPLLPLQVVSKRSNEKNTKTYPCSIRQVLVRQSSPLEAPFSLVFLSTP